MAVAAYGHEVIVYLQMPRASNLLRLEIPHPYIFLLRSLTTRCSSDVNHCLPDRLFSQQEVCAIQVGSLAVTAIYLVIPAGWYASCCLPRAMVANVQTMFGAYDLRSRRDSRHEPSK
ncbi:hypothetical protein FKP32DRAFT_1593936 [Trametes sanguinea]|nr:hypothetical protein FKP32DRAFT_1593936 [Trametes sanguinea]